MTVHSPQPTFADVNPEYAAFLEKFKPKLTSDDCFTPPNIYEAVRDWACAKYAIDPAAIVRPFWPGADYERFDYPEGCVVLDNPPFSRMSAILRFYAARRIRFFLFSHAMTLFKPVEGVNYVAVGVTITFANGAKIPVSFATSEGEFLVETAPELRDALEAIDKANAAKGKRHVTKLALPAACLTAMGAAYLSAHHTPYRLKRSDAMFIRRLEGLPGGLYGGGFLLSEKAAAEKAAAEKAAAVVVGLSAREKALPKSLGVQHEETP